MNTVLVTSRRLYLLAIPLLVGLVTVIMAHHRIFACAEFLDSDKSRLVNFLRTKYLLQQEKDIVITSGATLSGSCLRRISVSIPSQSRQMAFVLSEDKRYLFSNASDLSVSPKAVASINPFPTPVDMSALEAGSPPSLGTNSAPVTMVVFSDFQCPYCKRLEDALRELEPSERNKLRVVFRQFPLSIHQYSRQEAELSACTYQQNKNAFWVLHDFLFKNQTDLANANPVKSAIQFLRTRQDVDIPAVQGCLKNHQMATVVDNDLRLGQKYGVTATPTIFINGMTIVGTRNSTDLAKIIANKAAPQHTSTSTNVLSIAPNKGAL